MDGPPQGSPQGHGPDSTWSRSLRSQISAVGAAQRSFETFLESRQVDAESIFHAVLALEEAVTNVIKYACNDGREHEVRLEARLGATELVLRVTDDGREFNPCLAPPPDLTIPPEERPVGGLGVHLLRRLSSRMEYERSGGQNRLTLVFALKPRN